jgi:hypothetical protein
MKPRIQYVVLLVLLLTSLYSFSQKVVDVGKDLIATSNLFYIVNGEPVNNAKYVRVVDGSPYLNEAWADGKIILSGGRLYDNIKLRIDLVDNTLHYLTPDGTELIATTLVRSVLLKDPVTQLFTRFDNADFIPCTIKNDKGWYQILDSGTVTVYKSYRKNILESKPYGSATYEQTITTNFQYYIYKNAMLIPVVKFKQLPDMLQDKKSELQEYIYSNNLTGKTDADYVRFISYYNSLVKK